MGNSALPALIRDKFIAMAPTIEAMLPRHISIERFRAIALMQVLRGNPAVLACCATADGMRSMMGSLCQAAQLGLMPDGMMGEGYLVPFRKKGVALVTFIPGYRGYIKLAWQSEQLKSFIANPVFAKDEFTYSYDADGDHLHHVPSPEADPGAVIFAYAIARFVNGGSIVKVVSRREIDATRKRSKAPNSPAWTQDFAAMAMKTAVRRIANFLPTSNELALAAGIESAHDAGQAMDFGDLVPDVVTVDMKPAVESEDKEPETPAEEIKAALKEDPKTEDLGFEDPGDGTTRSLASLLGELKAAEENGDVRADHLEAFRKRNNIRGKRPFTKVQAMTLLGMIDDGRIETLVDDGVRG